MEQENEMGRLPEVVFENWRTLRGGAASRRYYRNDMGRRIQLTAEQAALYEWGKPVSSPTKSGKSVGYSRMGRLTQRREK